MGVSSYVGSITGTNYTSLRTSTSSKAGLSDLSSNSSSTSTSLEKYHTDYYCGTQVAIFMGDIWLSDISMIQYEMSQTKRPFYGYKSQKFDFVAKGTQIINGAFALNYTKANLLNQAVANYMKFGTSLAKDGQGTIASVAFGRFLDDIHNKSVSLDTLGTNEVSYTSDNGDPIKNMSFDEKAGLLESYFWGEDTKGVTSETVLTPDNLPAFDIMITFGNYAKERSVADEAISSHSLKVLNDLHITGHALQIATTGEPIQEVYSFIARGMDMPLTRTPSRSIIKT